MNITYQKYSYHKIKHSLQSGCCLKRVLLGICVGLLLSGCVGDVLDAPFWATREVIGGARSHLPKIKLTGEEKIVLEQNLPRLIEQIKWIDQYNVQNPNNKIYLDYSGLYSKSNCIFFISKIKLPVMWVGPNPRTSVYDCQAGWIDPQHGAIFNEEENEFNNKLYPDLFKFYGVSNGLVFLYLLDRFKEEKITFPNIPISGLSNYYSDPSSLKFLDTFNDETAAVRYVKKIFTFGATNESGAYSFSSYDERYIRYMSELQPLQN